MDQHYHSSKYILQFEQTLNIYSLTLQVFPQETNLREGRKDNCMRVVTICCIRKLFATPLAAAAAAHTVRDLSFSKFSPLKFEQVK